MDSLSLVEVPASDAAYRVWLEAYKANGWVVDLWPLPSPCPGYARPAVFHRADCPLVAPDPEWPDQHVGWGRAKLCSTSASALARCAQACGEFLLFCLCDGTRSPDDYPSRLRHVDFLGDIG
jgi:hypothetical protein